MSKEPNTPFRLHVFPLHINLRLCFSPGFYVFYALHIRLGGFLKSHANRLKILVRQKSEIKPPPAEWKDDKCLKIMVIKINKIPYGF